MQNEKRWEDYEYGELEKIRN